jgi:hypothetical protein
VTASVSSIKALAFLCFVLATLLAGSVQPLNACMTPRCCTLIGCNLCPESDTISGLAPAGITTVTYLGGRRAQIEISAYATPSMTITYDCSIAFSPVDGIERIDRITLVDTITRRPLLNYHWIPNEAPATEFAKMADELGVMALRSVAWQGYFTEVPGGSIGGIEHSFVFDVKLSEGTTVQGLVAALRHQGLLANGSANPDGTLDYGHYHLRRLGDGAIQVVFPARQAKEPVTRTKGADKR